jgi:flagellar hook-associated protein 3 FlgL
LQTLAGKIGDLDYAEAASRLNEEMVALQAAQQSFAKIQGLSLFNYIS